MNFRIGMSIPTKKEKIAETLIGSVLNLERFSTIWALKNIESLDA